MTNFFNKIEAQFNRGLPFAVYRKPDLSEITAWLQASDALKTTVDFKEEGFVFSPFMGSKPSVVFEKSHSEVLHANMSEVQTFSSKVKVKVETAQKTHYEQLVQKAIDEIDNTSLSKVVLSRQIEVPITLAEPLELFQNLMANYPHAFVYCWYHPQIGIWLGATPELLCDMTRNEVTTVSLAGTLKKGASHGWTNKERREQRLVTDYIVSKLQPLAKTIKEGQVQEVNAGDLTHLKTTVKALIDPGETGLKDLIRQLHPTPAVCGFPSDLALQFIQQHETYDRSYYTGFLGEMNMRKERRRSRSMRNLENTVFKSINTASQLYVNLRCLELKNKHAYIYVGGGIVESSVPEKEWQETIDKSNTILSVL